MKKSSKGIAIIPLLILIALAVGAVVYVGVANPSLLNTIEQKLKSIITPKPPIGTLTAARDLRGTWVSALRGKGIQLYGKFTTGPSVTKIYENGDIELKIDNVKNNIASGKIRYTNLCVTGGTTIPGYGTVSVPKTCTGDTGAGSIQIKISGSRLDFGTISVSGATASMQGNYTTDLMSGTMTMTSAYGIIKGEFHLNRKK